MRVRNITKRAVSSVNPPVEATIQRSLGWTYAADGSGKRTPTYAPAERVMIRVEAMQYNDIAQSSGLDIQGERRAVYMDGNWHGVVRADQTGGDLLVFFGQSWIVAMVAEDWHDDDGWVKLIVTRQLGAAVAMPGV